MTDRNQRRHERLAIELGAEIHTAERSFSAATQNLSEGGACIRGPFPVAEGSYVELALFLVVDGVEEAGFPPLEIRAQVQWTADGDDPSAPWRHIAGLRFDDISDENRAWLANVLSRRQQ